MGGPGVSIGRWRPGCRVGLLALALLFARESEGGPTAEPFELSFETEPLIWMPRSDGPLEVDGAATEPFADQPPAAPAPDADVSPAAGTGSEAAVEPPEDGESATASVLEDEDTLSRPTGQHEVSRLTGSVAFALNTNFMSYGLDV